MAATPLSAFHITSRIAASLLGGYLFVWGFVTLGITLQLHAGVSWADARTAVFLLAFLVYLAVFCWAFAAASLARVWAALAGGGALMTAAAWLLIPPLAAASA